MQAKQKLEAIYPLSFLQQILHFHSLNDAEDQGFLQVHCELKGIINLNEFKKSWQQIIQRHEVLRTSIHWEAIEKPLQVIHKEAKLPFKYIDWTELSSAEQKEKLKSLKNSEKENKLNLSVPPVLRVVLVKLAENRHSLLWSCHHILADGWSASVILHDLFSIYDTNINGVADSLPEIPSKRAFINWKKKQDKLQAKGFWRDLLRGFDSPTVIGDKGTTQSDNSFKSRSLIFSQFETKSLKDFSRENQITLNTLAQGIWAILLACYGCKDDVVFGVSVSGRSLSLPNAEFMAGMLMNVLPFRTKLRPEDNLSNWLKSLQRNQANISKYDYVELNEILGWTDTSTNSPLFDNLFVFENMPVTNLTGGGVSIETFESGLTSNYPLTLAVNPNKHLEFCLKYNISVVSEKKIEWFSDNLRNLVRYLVGHKVDSLGQIFKSITRFDSMENQIDESDQNTSSHFRPAKNDIELKLTRIWETLLGRCPIGITDDFFEVGGTSIIAIQLFFEIEKKFDQKLQPSLLLKHRTIEALSELIADSTIDEPWSSLVPLRASGTKLPIFCLHAAGGHIFFYRALAKHLGPDQPVYAMQRIGVEALDAAAESIETLASRYLKEIRTVQPNGPYALLGTCFSVPIAFEIAKQIKEAGESVSMLAVVDSPPTPNFFREPPLKDKIRRIGRMVKNFDWSFAPDILQRRLLNPIRYRWTYFFSRRQKQRELDLTAAINTTVENYVWRRYPVKVSLIRSKARAALSARDWEVNEWKNLAMDGVEVLVVPGEHHTVFQEPHVTVLAKQLQRCIKS